MKSEEEEEILEEDVADYRKGESQIIVEEFVVTLLDLPGAIQTYLVLYPLIFVTSIIARSLGWFHNSIFERYLVWYSIPQHSLI